MDSITQIVVVVLVVMVAFLIFRAVMLWYWRINEAITLLTSIDQRLGLLLGQGQLSTASQSGNNDPRALGAGLSNSSALSPFFDIPDSRLVESQLMEKYGIGYDGNYIFQGRQYDNFSAALNDAKVKSKG